MDEQFPDATTVAAFHSLLGYLNFSEGRPDPRFQKQLTGAYAFFAQRGEAEPWRALQRALNEKLRELHESSTGGFGDVHQAEAVLSLVFDKVLPAYRQHHPDLLFHQSDRDLFQPFFLARVCEAVLAQGSPWNESDRIVAAALNKLNDFVGHRPVAVLETRPRGEPYDHERVRPIPLFIKGAGVAWGRYHDLIAKALEVLAATDTAIRAEAYFELDLLDELAVDPRAYDFGHPVNGRPNYMFGEWDPHHIDNQGRYRRFVVRQIALDALLDRIEHRGDIRESEALFEAGAVLAGIILMASGQSGSGPDTHDSTTTLATLTPRIARYRDAFYRQLLEGAAGPHGDRLRQEAQLTRQPFGGVRQHLNRYLARQRALQLQQRHLALILAEMGYSEASRRQAARIPVASVRMKSDIRVRLVAGQQHVEQGELVEAARLLPEIEDLLHRGIACGALVDPWNILGFQGLFPLFTAREDSVHDPRIDDLVEVVERLLDLYAALMSEAAAAGERPLVAQLGTAMRKLADWWDKFATIEVGGIRRVHGSEAVTAAKHVADALARWQERGEATADLAFWKQHLEGFRSPKAFALVVEALLDKSDFRASMALLMSWLGQVEQVPLEEGDYSFHALALRWLLELASEEHQLSDRWALIRKFFDYLEANAEEYWDVPVLEATDEAGETHDEKEDGDLYEAAYAGVTYKDSADDDEEGAVAEGGPLGEFDLEEEGQYLEWRLRLLVTVAQLWLIAARHASRFAAAPGSRDALSSWLTTALRNHRQLLILLDELHAHPIPEATGSHESLVEYDRRQGIKEHLLSIVVGTAVETTQAIRALRRLVAVLAEASEDAPWEPSAIALEKAIQQGDTAAARAVLPKFLEDFQKEPLLFVPLATADDPRQVLRARVAQTFVMELVAQLPRLGLLRETYHLLTTARKMEENFVPPGRRVTEFDRLFETGFQSAIQAVVDSAPSWDIATLQMLATEQVSGLAAAVDLDRALVAVLERLAMPFLNLWGEHSRTVRVSVLESIGTDEQWETVKGLIQRYGGDLFDAKFLTLGNLRGILDRGAGAYFDYLRDNPDPLRPVGLIEALDDAIPRDQAVSWFQFVLRAIIENYEEYKDYNTTTTQSDYGEDLHTLLDFLRLKARYERQAWLFRPLMQVHEVLVRNARFEAATLWRQTVTRYTEFFANLLLRELARLEEVYGIRLSTIADRLGERFSARLELDHLCALIEPALDEAEQPENRWFAEFERLLAERAATPSGVGLDVPQWLRRLEQEVERAQAETSALFELGVEQLALPQHVIPFEEIQRQLDEWDQTGVG
ncbi:MAG TPA: hypothetical protein VKI65_10075 [Gemmataceae bacterium]|nr:hypothetical protein [Gemmataceae bacterium]